MPRQEPVVRPDAEEVENALPLEARVPEAMHASPSDLPHDAPIRWWRPGWADVREFVGWRCWLLAPAVLFVLLFAGAIFNRGMRSVLLLLGAKVLVFSVACAVALAGYVMRRAARARREPFCIHCGYNLSGLPDHHRCPECGAAYSWKVIAEYRRDPQWFIERHAAARDLPAAPQPLEAGRIGRAPRSRDGT